LEEVEEVEEVEDALREVGERSEERREPYSLDTEESSSSEFPRTQKSGRGK